MENRFTAEPVTAGNIVMDTVRFGEGGTPLVVLPGMTMRNAFASPGALAMSYKAFREDFSVTVIGRRYDLPDGYDIRQMAEDTVQVIRALGIEQCMIFGISQGGMMAQVMALEDWVEWYREVYL